MKPFGDSTKQVSSIHSPGLLSDDETPIWCTCEGSAFQVRCGPNYAANKKKHSSLDSFYECVAADVLQSQPGTNKPLSHVARSFKLPEVEKIDEQILSMAGLPRFLIVNIQVPFKKSPNFYTAKNYFKDDNGCSIVFVYLIKPDVLAAACKQDLTEEEFPSLAQLQLLRKFNQEAATNPDIKRRFKGLLSCANWDDMMDKVNVPGLRMFKSYNGKPIILNRLGTLFQDEGKTEYLEMDVAIQDTKLMARKALDSFRQHSPEAVLQVGFTVQGETDDELPETVIACSIISQVTLDKTKVPTIDT